MLEIGDIVRFETSRVNFSEDGKGIFWLVINMGDGKDTVIARFRKKESVPVADERFMLFSSTDLTDGQLINSENYFLCLHDTITVSRADLEWCARVKPEIVERALRKLIKLHTTTVYQLSHGPKEFVPKRSHVPVAGRCFGPEEMHSLVDSAMDFWLTTGHFNDAFEKKFASFLDINYALTTNSGSSANLLAVSALTSPKLGEKRLLPGDEVITVAAGFPTTVNPIIQNGLIPVFVDIDIPTYNIKAELIEAAISEKTKAIILAHTLGNPFDVDEVVRVTQKYGLWLIEDCCDALGSNYFIKPERSMIDAGSVKGGEKIKRKCGTFGHISTFSFYPAHHITMGEGGAIATNDQNLCRIITSFRDWGRDCWCQPGKDNTCRHRFSKQLGDLPFGYDHKYTYSHLGYNLKITDMQAAVGVAQLDRISDFIVARKNNFKLLSNGLKEMEAFLVLPEQTLNAEAAWFGFPVTVRSDSRLKRVELLKHLDELNIGTRLLFGGNLIRQPYMAGREYRISGELANTESVMNNTFWIGVYPGLNEKHISYIIESIRGFLMHLNKF